MIYYNAKDSSIWLSNSSAGGLEGKEGEEFEQRLMRVNFFEEPAEREIALPEESPVAKEGRLRFEEGRFGYSGYLQKYILASDTSFVIFGEDSETGFSRKLDVIQLKDFGKFERCKMKFLQKSSTRHQVVIVQYNRFRNWRFLLFDFDLMATVLDLEFKGDFSIKKDIELVQFEKVDLRHEEGGIKPPMQTESEESDHRGRLVTIVDSFFNRFVIVDFSQKAKKSVERGLKKGITKKEKS